MLQVVWYDVSEAGESWQVQRASDPDFTESLTIVAGSPSLLCSSCTSQLTLSDPAPAGRRYGKGCCIESSC